MKQYSEGQRQEGGGVVRAEEEERGIIRNKAMRQLIQTHIVENSESVRAASLYTAGLAATKRSLRTPFSGSCMQAHRCKHGQCKHTGASKVNASTDLDRLHEAHEKGSTSHSMRMYP